MLNPGPKRSNLNVRWNKKSRAFVVDNLFSIECEEFDDLVAVLEEGNHKINKTFIALKNYNTLFYESYNTMIKFIYFRP